MKSTLAKILDEARSRNLPFLLIGGNAMIIHGFARNTIDLDFLVPEPSRKPWSEMLTSLGFHCFHMTSAFSQFSGRHKRVPVDLLFVNEDTLAKLPAEAVKIQVMSYEIQIPAQNISWRSSSMPLQTLRAAIRKQTGKTSAIWSPTTISTSTKPPSDSLFIVTVAMRPSNASSPLRNEKPDPYFRPPRAS